MGWSSATSVMKRRAVRRFEEGGVDPAVIEGIARLAQRTPSAGFSQGQRLVVVTDPEARRRVARICGEEAYADLEMGPWISECAAQFVPCVSEEIYHRRYQEPDKVDEDGPRDRVAGPLLVGRHRGHDDGDHAGGRRRRAGLGLRRRVRPRPLRAELGDPRRVRADRGHAGGPAAARTSARRR